MLKQVVKSKSTSNLSSKHRQDTLPLSRPTSTLTPKKSKKDLKKEVKEIKEWLEGVQIY